MGISRFPVAPVSDSQILSVVSNSTGWGSYVDTRESVYCFSKRTNTPPQ